MISAWLSTGYNIYEMTMFFTVLLLLSGNENIHKISSHGRHDFKRGEMSDFDNQVKYAEYIMFSIGDERDGYKLFVGGYFGDAGNVINVFLDVNGSSCMQNYTFRF